MKIKFCDDNFEFTYEIDDISKVDEVNAIIEQEVSKWYAAANCDDSIPECFEDSDEMNAYYYGCVCDFIDSRLDDLEISYKFSE